MSLLHDGVNSELPGNKVFSDLHQNWINSSLQHTQSVHKVSSESVYNFLRYCAMYHFWPCLSMVKNHLKMIGSRSRFRFRSYACCWLHGYGGGLGILGSWVQVLLGCWINVRWGWLCLSSFWGRQKMSGSVLVSCVGVATHPGLCPIVKETAYAAPTLCTEYGPNGWMGGQTK